MSNISLIKKNIVKTYKTFAHNLYVWQFYHQRITCLIANSITQFQFYQYEQRVLISSYHIAKVVFNVL